MTEVIATGMLSMYPGVCSEDFPILMHTIPIQVYIRRRQTLFRLQVKASQGLGQRAAEMEAYVFRYVVSETTNRPIRFLWAKKVAPDTYI